MANTLKFGNGEWAIKEGSALAYNDENGNFKPLPFDFSRNTTATRVNKEGLIEVVSNNEPRIDFLDNSDGSLKLEPQRTNLITYSEDFSNAAWSKNNSSVVSGFTSPDGTANAFKLVEDTSTTPHFMTINLSRTSGLEYSYSVYVKSSGRDIFNLSANSAINADAFFNISNGTVDVTTGSAKIEQIGDYYRCSITGTATSTGIATFYATLSTSGNVNNYQGDGTSGVYIWGAQLEQGSYATSYIPTQGSAATRVADSCSQTPPSGIIGQTEGTLFFNADITNSFGVQLGNSSGGGDYVNSIQIAFNAIGTYSNIFNGGANQFSYAGAANTGVIKAALAYKQNDFAIYIDGNQITTDNSGTIPSISGIFFNHQDLSTTGGVITDVKLYNTRLSNAELATLTTL